jgi:hypothetical protein
MHRETESIVAHACTGKSETESNRAHACTGKSETESIIIAKLLRTQLRMRIYVAQTLCSSGSFERQGAQW